MRAELSRAKESRVEQKEYMSLVRTTGLVERGEGRYLDGSVLLEFSLQLPVGGLVRESSHEQSGISISADRR